MRDLVIGDLHFGIKSNSIIWLDLQVKFIKEQVYNIINTNNIDRIVFLGDIFDIRYAINQQVGIEVKKLIRELSNKFNKEILFIGGNHDYYSPIEEFDEYNAYELVFGEEFVKCHTNIKFITREPYLTGDGALCLPWYYTENPEHFDDILYNYKMGKDVQRIYCHTDLSVWPGARITALRGVPVYSGHIHYPYTDTLANLYNLGAALPLTFNDVNSDRHIFIIEDNIIVSEIKNITTPSFKRYYNEDIFDLNKEVFNNSYVQLCVSTSNINSARYIDKLKEIKTTYVGSNIRINAVDDTETGELVETGAGFNTNINKYIDSNMPEHLNKKYEYIKKKITDNIE